MSRNKDLIMALWILIFDIVCPGTEILDFFFGSQKVGYALDLVVLRVSEKIFLTLKLSS